MTDKTEAQPEALRLAEQLLEQAVQHRDLAHCCDCRPEDTVNWDHYLQCRDAANELRRQHAEIQQLKAQLSARQAAPDGQWKCGNEYLPYHPDASHIDPAYRDGWNDCYRAAPAQPEREPLTDELIWAMEQLMNWQVKNVKKWHNHAYDNAQHVLEKFKAAHGIGATNDNP